MTSGELRAPGGGLWGLGAKHGQLAESAGWLLLAVTCRGGTEHRLPGSPGHGECPVQDLTGNVCKKKEKRRGYHCSKVAVTLLTRAAHPDSQRAYLGLETYSLPFCRCPCEVRARMHSLWSWLSQPKEQQRLRNPLYILNPLAICGAPEPAAGQGEPHTFSTGDYPSAQCPDLCSSSSGLFLRWTHSPEPAEAAWGKSVANSDRKGEDRSLSANYFSPHPKHWLLGQQPRHS
ncbi:uncharacterized protein [Macaca nemestrina]|uniref:uncharacterized protein isoform X1 n=1 Tax=Macaca nemestrina TaxID=9545 RepID=UPI0039B98E8E